MPQIFFIVMLVYAIMYAFCARAKYKRLIREWAERRGYRVTKSEFRWMRRGPFSYGRGKQSVYYVGVQSSDFEETRYAYLRCGGKWSGIISDTIEVEWDWPDNKQSLVDRIRDFCDGEIGWKNFLKKLLKSTMIIVRVVALYLLFFSMPSWFEAIPIRHYQGERFLIPEGAKAFYQNHGNTIFVFHGTIAEEPFLFIASAIAFFLLLFSLYRTFNRSSFKGSLFQ